MKSVIQAVSDRLTTFGFAFDDLTENEIEYAVNRAKQSIEAEINSSDIPEGLFYVWVDMAVGYLISDRKAVGKLGDSLDLTAPAKSITEGDLSVTLAGLSDGVLTAEARLDKLITTLTKPSQSVFARYRRLVW